VLACLVAAGTVAACYAPGAPHALPTGPDFVIGASLELSGPAAELGLTAQRALQIAVDDVNTTGVRIGDRVHRLRLIVRDNGGDATAAAAATEQLITAEQAVAVVGGATAGTSLAMAPVAEARRVPMLSLAGTERITLPVPQRRYVFTLAPKSPDVADSIFARLKLATRSRVVVLAATGPYGDAGASATELAARTHGIVIDRTVRYLESGSDLAARAVRAVESQPDAIVVWAVLPGPGTIARAIRNTGYQGAIIFDSGAGGEAAFDADDWEAAEGAEMVHPLILAGSQLAVTTPSGLAQRDFFIRYTQLHGRFNGHAPMPPMPSISSRKRSNGRRRPTVRASATSWSRRSTRASRARTRSPRSVTAASSPTRWWCSGCAPATGSGPRSRRRHHAGLDQAGLGHAGLGHAGLGHAGLGHAGAVARWRRSERTCSTSAMRICLVDSRLRASQLSTGTSGEMARASRTSLASWYCTPSKQLMATR